ncbi:hypothetical protein GGR58DRAFT_502513 [Xylaria digitata]|nr:hypothetical protein GGR58DRAFT_502513 [Xylaria digitata]
MRYAALILSVLAAALANARNPLNPISKKAELYAPTYIMDTPADWPGGENSSIVLKCEKKGKTCMSFPKGAPENETISVRVICVEKTYIDQNKTVLAPSLMNPCPAGSRCALVVENPTPPSNDSWPWLEDEDEDGEIAGLREEEEEGISSWMNLDGLLHEVDAGVNITTVRDEKPYIPDPTLEKSEKKEEKPKLVCVVDEDSPGS